MATRLPPRRPDGTIDLVTTHLELRRLPRIPRVSISGRTLSLVHARRFPLHFYRYLYNTVGAPHLWWECREMDDDTLAATVLDDQVELHVFQVDGTPAGFAELDRRQTGEVDIVKFGLIPEYVGQGLGLGFLGRVIEAAWQDDTDRITVHACSTDHPRALLVYQRIGFAAYDEVRETIDDPRDRGLFLEHESAANSMLGAIVSLDDDPEDAESAANEDDPPRIP